METDKFAQLTYMLALLIWIGGGTFRSLVRTPLSSLIKGMLIWLAIAGIAFIGYAFRNDVDMIVARVQQTLQPGTFQSSVDENGERSVTLSLAGDTHFHANAKIEGAKVHFIVDTGASNVTLTHEDARLAGIDTNRLAYIWPVETANGRTRFAQTRLETIRIGPIASGPIRVFIAPKGTLNTSLLGMNFLQKLSSYEVRRNQMIMRQ